MRCDAIRQLVQLAIGQARLLERDGGGVGICLRRAAEQSRDVGVLHGPSRVVESGEVVLCLLRKEGYLVHLLAPQQRLRDHGHALHDGANLPLLIACALVLAFDLISIVRVEHEEDHRFLRGIWLQGGGLRRQSSHSLQLAKLRLIGKHDAWADVQVVGDLREGIDVVRHAFGQLPAHPSDEASAVLVLAHVADDGKRVDEHADGVDQPRVVPPVVDRGVHAVVAVDEAAERQSKGGVPQGVGGELLPAQDLLDVLALQSGVHADRSWHRDRPAVVLQGEAIGVPARQQVGKVVLRVLERGAFAQLPLSQCGLVAGEGLLFQRRSFVRLLHVAEEDAHGLPVKDEVMRVEEEPQGVVVPDEGDADQRRSRQLEGIDQTGKPHRQLGLVQLLNRHLCVIVPLCPDLAVIRRDELCLDVGMRVHRCPERRLQAIGVHLWVQLDEEGEVVGRGARIGQAVDVDALLDVGQRVSLLKCVGRIFLDGAQEGGDVSDGMQLCQVAEAHGVLEGPGKQDVQAHRGDGGEARVFQIGGDAEVAVPHRFDRAAQHELLVLGGGFLVVGDLSLWKREGALVDLVVLRQGNGVELHDRRRHHVGRLLFPDECLQGRYVHGAVGDHVGRQALQPGALVGKGLDRCVLDAGVLTDDHLDLRQLDAKAAHLHLAVAASDEVHPAVGKHPDHVARPVGRAVCRVLREGIGHKGLRRLFRKVEVAAADVRAGDQQLARREGRQPTEQVVHHVQLYVGQRLADGDPVVLLVHGLDGHEHGAFRRSIGVEELGPEVRRVEGRQRLATHDEVLQAAARVALGKLPAHLGRH